MSVAAGIREAAAPSFLATSRGKLTPAFLCMVGFLDFVDASIVNVALPSIRTDLHFSIESLQWVLSGYLLTYGGFMLLGGRAADLLGRRRILVSGMIVFALSSLTAGLATGPATLVGARLVQGLGAGGLMMLAGSAVRGGWASQFPGCASDAQIDPDGNLKVATDFRSVYQAVIHEWLGDDPAAILPGGPFPALVRPDGLTGLMG